MFAGVDVGGTKIEVALMSSDMTLRGAAQRPTDIASPSHIVAGIADALNEACRAASAMPRLVRCVGIGVPGQVDTAQGQVNLAVNLNMDHYPLAGAVTTAFGVPCVLENDVRIAALGAWHYIRGNRTRGRLAYLNFGTGISAGLVVDGRVVRGAHGMAGEIGHVVVDPMGELCACGLRGCLETVASGAAVMRQMEAQGLTKTLDDPSPRAPHLFRAAQAGNAQAAAIVQRVSRAIATAIQWLVMAWDPEMVVLGGGLTRAGELFFAPVRAELLAWRQASAVAATLLQDEKFVLLPPDFNAGVWGAALLAKASVPHADRLELDKA
jgi:glucokinase